MIRRPSFYVVLVVWGLCHVQAEAGPKAKSAYPFQLPPAKAFDVLEDLSKISKGKVAVSKDERTLFADIKDGKPQKHSFAEAALLASGVTDSAKRQTYLKRIDELEAGTRKAIADAKTIKEKGEKLLKFIHTGPMAKGYAIEQTDLSVILDTNKFNCVSSAILYNILAQRLGMQARGVRVPNHVFSVLLDAGSMIVVETTSNRGFNAHRRLPKDTISEMALVASIYYNHGVAFIEQKKFHEAVVANFCALALDPEDADAVRNVRAALINWGLDLEQAGKFEDAISLCELGLKLDPKNGTLKNNRKVFWIHYAEAAMKAGKEAEAIQILKRAAKQDPKGNFEFFQAHLYLKPGEELIKAGKWDEALKIVTKGLERVDAKAKEILQDWRVGLFMRWAQTEERAKRFDKALSILKRGLELEPEDGRLKNNAVATYDSWARTHMDAGNWADAVEVYEQGLRHLPGNGHLTNNLNYCKSKMMR